ncbi:MAG: hypothetical protein ABIW35_07680 [Luteimonas sp.]
MRARQQETLHLVATALAKPLELLARFHALGDRAERNAALRACRPSLR